MKLLISWIEKKVTDYMVSWVRGNALSISEYIFGMNPIRRYEQISGHELYCSEFPNKEHRRSERFNIDTIIPRRLYCKNCGFELYEEYSFDEKDGGYIVNEVRLVISKGEVYIDTVIIKGSFKDLKYEYFKYDDISCEEYKKYAVVEDILE